MNEPQLPLRRRVENNDHEFTVFTYELSMAHGPNRNQYYETIIEEGPGAGVVDRYETEEEARIGHDEICDDLYNRNYELEPVSYMLRFDDDEA